MQESEGAGDGQYESLLKFIGEYYYLLGIGIEASKEEVNKAYKEHLKLWNLEKFENEPIMKKKAQQMIRDLDEAYENIILYMSHPQYQNHPIKISKPAPVSKRKQKNKTNEIPEYAGIKKRRLPMLSIRSIKPFTAWPNILLIIYTIFVVGFQLNHYKAFSVYLIPRVISMSLWYLIPPFVVCLIYNLVEGGAKKIKIVSVCLTLSYFFVIAPMSFGIYEKIFSDPVSTSSLEDPSQAWVLKGNEFKSENKYNSAIEAYSRAIELNPGNPDAYYNRSVVYSLMRKDEEFVRDCRTAANMGHNEAIRVLNNFDIRYQTPQK